MDTAPQQAPTIVQAPQLDNDAMMLQRFGSKVSPNGRLERRIVANLIAHLGRAGFHPKQVDDGGDRIKTPNVKSAMEAIFAVDQAHLFVRKNADCAAHWIFLVLGNGIDVLSDWSYSVGDPDGFNAAMDGFDAELYA